jgi:hypothetical protein
MHILLISDVCVLQVGTFTLFQETYHRPTFQQMHVSGPKSDFDHRLLTQDRAMRAGLDDVGIGTLFGLYDYKYEVSGGVLSAVPSQCWHSLSAFCAACSQENEN